MSLRPHIQELIAGRDLRETAAFEAASTIVSGAASGEQIAALLVALRMKGETVDEISGFVRAMRAAATPAPIAGDDLLDTCGTGGDGLGTFNISTVTAFVAAGAGVRVAKHGNRSNQSASGSSDVLRALGVNVEASPEATARCIATHGIGFFLAPQYHPGVRHALAARREIGVRTIFNTIGPLVHPAHARRQVIGVYDGRLTEPLAEVLRRAGSTRCFVVHGDDGLDEISLAGPTRMTELRDETIRTITRTPEDWGVASAPIEALRGGTPEENAAITRAILDGEPGPRRDIVLVNAAAAIETAELAATPRAALELARRSIDSGAARAKLDALVAWR